MVLEYAEDKLNARFDNCSCHSWLQRNMLYSLISVCYIKYFALFWIVYNIKHFYEIDFRLSIIK